MRILLTSSCIFTALISISQVVTLDTAITAAQNSYKQRFPTRNDSVLDHYTHYENNNPTYYIISFVNGGAIGISANKSVKPIIFLFEDEIYDNSKYHNPSFNRWMENVSYHIDSININKWDSLLNNKFKASTKAYVNPLIQSNWGQGWPYNILADEPQVASMCTDDNCATGGVTTAMAQIMRYYQHPVSTSFAYYDYCNMPAEWIDIIECQDCIDEISVLMRDIGDKNNTSYCLLLLTCESFTFPTDAKNAFVDYFKYSDDANVDRRGWYSKSQWETKIKMRYMQVDRYSILH